MNTQRDHPFWADREPPRWPQQQHPQQQHPQHQQPSQQQPPPPPPDPRRGRSGTLKNAGIALGSIVLASVLGAVATALITPETFRGFGAGPARETATPIPADPVFLVPKHHPDGGLSVDVPEDWPVARAEYNPLLKPQAGQGTSMSLGPDSGHLRAGGTRMAVAAGRDLVTELGVTPANKQQVMRDTVAHLDWTVDGCVLREDEEFRSVQMEGQLRHWTGCDGLSKSHLWEVIALTNDGAAVAVVQLQHMDDVSEDQATRILDSVRVQPAQLQS